MFETLASQLLQWPSISSTITPILARQVEYAEHYPWSHEVRSESSIPHTIDSLKLRLHPVDIRRYVESFKEHILTMHPILLSANVDAMVNQFVEGHGIKSSDSPPTYVARPTTGQYMPRAGDEGEPRQQTEAVAFAGKPEALFRNIESVLVLLFLALGKLCLHPGVLPGAGQESKQIPGLEYFAVASQIIGGHFGDCTLERVHAHILIGLYQGQLGKVVKSHDHVSTASRTLQVAMRFDKDALILKTTCDENNVRENQLAISFWTCVLLESDILSQLPLPDSGISKDEKDMPYPSVDFLTRHGFRKGIAECYIMHIFMRKQLGSISKSAPSSLSIDEWPEEAAAVFKSLLSRQWIHADYTWRDDDPLPTDLLKASFRDAYWASICALYRPFLHKILMGNTLAGATENIDEHARQAVNALIENTRAFHGIQNYRRLIVTNIFGIAHRQWENLMTLSACYKHEMLQEYIDKDRLRHLYTLVIEFFTTVASQDGALATDLKILIELEEHLGLA
ncbi:hypothetical protein GGR57DRAFT_505749 [Xylariaceae sp. FL1272]|nr:hypothetical protein GGR57DRAFT_505749 [Xylariaceae sp. FL1272]